MHAKPQRNGAVNQRRAKASERHEKTRIRDGLHFRENPLRLDRSAGPEAVPARRINGFPLPVLTFLICSRTILPT